MIIDTHVHFRRPQVDSAQDLWGETCKIFERMLEIAERSGITKVCILADRELLLGLLERYPEQIFGYLYVDPYDQKKSIADIEECMKVEGMIGIKIGGGGEKACKASNPVLYPLVEKLIELDSLLLMHAWDKTTGNFENESNPSDVADLAGRYPKLKIQMAHLSGAGYRGILEVAPYENVFFDCSGGYPEVGFIEWGIEVLGPERIVFGSDVPGRDFAVQLAKVQDAEISEKHRKMILAENILNWMGGEVDVN